MAKGKYNVSANYKPRQSLSVNIDEKTLKFLKYMKQQKHILNVSDGVRRMLNFAMPYFLHSNIVIDEYLENKITDFKFKEPAKLTLKQLRELYPNTIDYKYINERK